MPDETQLPAGDIPQASSDVPQDPNAGASAAALSSTAETTSAQIASADAGVLLNGESSAEPKTFEQRVEERFLALERALMGLPHSIMHVMHQGSMEADEFAKRVLAHLFGNQ